MTAVAANETPNRARDLRHALGIVAVVVLGYAITPTRLPLIGEETCRALHGIEMARTGDWLVATNQSVPILDRPPLQVPGRSRSCSGSCIRSIH